MGAPITGPAAAPRRPIDCVRLQSRGPVRDLCGFRFRRQPSPRSPRRRLWNAAGAAPWPLPCRSTGTEPGERIGRLCFVFKAPCRRVPQHHSPAAVQRALRSAFASTVPRHADATASDAWLRLSQTPTALEPIESAIRIEGGKLVARASALRSGFASPVPQDAGLARSKGGLRKVDLRYSGHAGVLRDLAT
jgi:hypothetical protein